MVSTTSANAGIRSSYGAASYIFLICCRLLPRSRSASSVFTAVRLRLWMHALKRHLLTPAHTFTCPPWLEPTRYSTPHHNTIQRSTFRWRTQHCRHHRLPFTTSRWLWCAGLSPELKTMDCVRAIERPTVIPDFGVVCDLVWADPDPDLRGWLLASCSRWSCMCMWTCVCVCVCVCVYLCLSMFFKRVTSRLIRVGAERAWCFVYFWARRYS